MHEVEPPLPGFAEEVEQRREIYSGHFVSMAWFFLSFGLATQVLIWLLFEKGMGSRISDPVDAVPLLLLGPLLGAARTFPRLRRGAGLRFAHALLMLVLLLFALPVTQTRRFIVLHWNAAIVALRVFVGLQTHEVVVSFACNLVYCVAMLCCTPLIPPTSRFEFIGNELFTLMLVTVVLGSLQRSLVEGVAHDVRDELFRVQQAAATDLLNMVCDAVVELDHGLRIVGESQKLACILLRGECKMISGEEFERFVAAADRDYFARKIAGTESEMFPIRVRDAHGGSINMDLFHVPFRSVGGQASHLVGLREVPDFEERLRTRNVTDSDFGVEACHLSSGDLAPCPMYRFELPVIPKPDFHKRHLDVTSSGLQIDVLAKLPLPVVNMTSAAKRALGETKFLSAWLAPGENFAQWVVDTADQVWAGEVYSGVRSYGKLGLARQGAEVERRQAVAFFLPPMHAADADGDLTARHKYMVSVKLEDLDAACHAVESSRRSRSGSSHGTFARVERHAFGTGLAEQGSSRTMIGRESL